MLTWPNWRPVRSLTSVASARVPAAIKLKDMAGCPERQVFGPGRAGHRGRTAGVHRALAGGRDTCSAQSSKWPAAHTTLRKCRNLSRSKIWVVVLLAAGGSSRLGQPKQLIPIGGEALVRRTARNLLCLEPASLIVVTGCASAEVAGQLSGLPLQVVHNPEWQKGMGTSIALGVKNLPKKVKGVLIMLCDQWCVSQDDLKRLFEAWISDISVIVSARWKSDKTIIFGPPVIFPGTLFHELKDCPVTRGQSA